VTWHDGIILYKDCPEMSMQKLSDRYVNVCPSSWYLHCECRRSLFDMLTGLWHGVSRNHGWIPDMARNFFYTPISPPSPIFNGYRGMFLVTKWARCKADHPHHLVSKLRMSGAIPPRLFSLRAQVDFIALYCINSVTYTWEQFGFWASCQSFASRNPTLVKPT
jgi:hypothetical protein